MRKRNIKKVADTIFWYVVYLLPIILTVIQSIAIFGNFTFDNWQQMQVEGSFANYDFLTLFESNLGFLGCENGLIVDTLRAIFSDEGIVFFFDGWSIFGFAQWFVGTMLIHLCVDFILFIPRIAHKWMDTLVKED